MVAFTSNFSQQTEKDSIGARRAGMGAGGWDRLVAAGGVGADGSFDDLANPVAPAVAIDPHLATRRLMLVEFDELSGRITRALLRDLGFQSVVLRPANEAVAAASDPEEQADLILVGQSRLNGAGALNCVQLLRANPITALVPILMVRPALYHSPTDDEWLGEALRAGATDFVPQPIEANILLPRVTNALKNRLFEQEFRQWASRVQDDSHREVAAAQKEWVHACGLGHAAQRSSLAAEQTRLDAVHCLARAAEHRDSETGHHITRVGRYSGEIARRLGFAEDHVQLLETAAPLHDVGKIGIPDHTLLKPGPLDDEEMGIVRQHAEIGGQILGGSSDSLLRTAHMIALTHHERVDGAGYPHNLSGGEIPIEGRIVAVADVFDALGTRRPYKDAFDERQCLEILQSGRGTHFDEEVLEAFLACMPEIRQIRRTLDDLEH